MRRDFDTINSFVLLTVIEKKAILQQCYARSLREFSLRKLRSPAFSYVLYEFPLQKVSILRFINKNLIVKTSE